ncbi:translation initiation factor IF-2 [Desulfurivibrio alkaliphilus]|uniref:Translation initiation factor IF-2 n=1 Tax=Desulfurivibrio alkaliphilus (strain DSM 19089 / UNIQEM U267 / AHT2) TaxID=589865 RepID=D6Z4T5_DESAT|nr:translation initiation factor IF-2 [Desulfurivibrio alkaliphilus]ADH86560.1 translation initiation factor IF-2 [Desulfurivibrio alkaliphilus AHT 2]
MKKIRVYELAKEAGLENKVLVARLQEDGYQVKSHSSTLTEDEAREIRVKLGLLQTETKEKRIQDQGRRTIIRRRKAVVQPPAEEAPAAPESPAESTAPAAEEAEQPAAAPEAPAAPAEGVAPPVSAAPEAGPAKASVEAPAAEAAPEVEAEKAPKTAAEEAPAAAAEPAPAAAEEPPPAPATEAPAAAAAEAPAAEPATPAQAPERKGLARVIKRAAITITPSPEERPRPRKPEKGKKPAVAAGEPDFDDAAGKKKGKRFVKFTPEVDRGPAKKGAAGKRKRKAEVVAEDFDELGLVPAGVRLGRGGRGGGKRKQQHDKPQFAAETKAIKKRITVYETISVGDLAHRMGAKANEVIAKLMGLGVMATVNQAMDFDTAALVAAEFGYEVEQGKTEEQTILTLEEEETGGELKPRPPVVTVMGHVDHGKTSILDAIRKSDVAAGEAGGITQHIGAHHVRAPQGEVVFLDTPGHEAFTEMRSRGAQVTDIVVLVVAADDSVMDQTREAINHARAAEVPILVCINKIDKENADPMRVKRELADLGLMSEEWGGDTIYCETSAKKGIGIDTLLDNILLQSEVLELKADPQRHAKGHVIEAQLHKGRGPVATVLVQQGTLRVGDAFVAGQFAGKVRSLINDKGEQVQEAGPSFPVEIQGLSGVPQAGDEFIVVRDDKMAKNVSAERQLKLREKELATDSKISLENLFDRMQEGEVKELMVVLRADVQGTLEAFSSSLEQLSTDNVKVRVLNSGTGTVNESDVLLAAASDALIIGFNVRPNARIQELAKREKVDMRFYDVIYHALEDIKKAMEGLLEPEFIEEVIGTAEVRQTFHVSKVGTIAGCYVTDGKAERNAQVRLLRDGVVVHTGQLSSLKRFKDDAKEVASGYECGISLRNYNDIKEGDVLEFFVMKEIQPEL